MSGTEYMDANAVKLFSGLQVGDKITVPGDRSARPYGTCGDQKLFADVRIEAAEIRGKTIFLNIIVQERPRLSRFKFEGVQERGRQAEGGSKARARAAGEPGPAHQYPAHHPPLLPWTKAT